MSLQIYDLLKHLICVFLIILVFGNDAGNRRQMTHRVCDGRTIGTQENLRMVS